MILVKNWNFPLLFVFNKIGLEIMFADNPVRKQAYLDWKIKILPSRPIEIFLKGLTHDSGQQLEFFLCLLLNKKRLEKMFPDHPVRKQAYLDWKIKILPSRPMEVFLGKTSFKFSAPKIWETVPPGLKCLPYHNFKEEWKSCHLSNQTWP